MHKFFVATTVSLGLCALFLGTVITSLPAQAQPTTAPAASAASRSPRSASGWYGFVDPLENATIPEVINKVTRFALGIVGAVFLIYFIYGGLLWMTAGGDPKQVTKGKTALVQSATGIVIVVFSYSVIGFIIQLTNQLQTTPAAN